MLELWLEGENIIQYTCLCLKLYCLLSSDINNIIFFINHSFGLEKFLPAFHFHIMYCILSLVLYERHKMSCLSFYVYEVFIF